MSKGISGEEFQQREDEAEPGDIQLGIYQRETKLVKSQTRACLGHDYTSIHGPFKTTELWYGEL